MSTDLTPLLVLAKRLRATLMRDDDPVAAIQRARAEVTDLIDAIREARDAAGAECSGCGGSGYRWYAAGGTEACARCGGTGMAG